MVATERGVDHDKSSMESLLGLAGLAGFVLLEHADVVAEPRRVTREHWAHSWESLAALGCAGLTWYGLRRGAPKLGAGLAGLMVGYEVFLKRYPGKGGANVPLPRFMAGTKAPWGGDGKPNGTEGPPPPPSPCPVGQMWDPGIQACVFEPLPWPIGPRTGLTWAEVEGGTPDLAAARRAAEIAWHSYLELPGPVQMGYKFGMGIPLPGGQR